MAVLTTGYLMINSWTDWRKKEIDIVWTVAVFILTAFLYIKTGKALYWSGILPGIGLWMISLWKPEQIGSGDGMILMGIGWIEGIRRACMIFQNAILLAAVPAICMLVRGEKKREIPFVPFLLAGYLIQCLQ